MHPEVMAGSFEPHKSSSWIQNSRLSSPSPWTDGEFPDQKFNTQSSSISSILISKFHGEFNMNSPSWGQSSQSSQCQLQVRIPRHHGHISWVLRRAPKLAEKTRKSGYGWIQTCHDLWTLFFFVPFLAIESLCFQDEYWNLGRNVEIHTIAGDSITFPPSNSRLHLPAPWQSARCPAKSWIEGVFWCDERDRFSVRNQQFHTFDGPSKCFLQPWRSCLRSLWGWVV